uniref:Phosphoribosylformylglycinamidine synthase n=1 Tax=Phallusia mammillata TaxID=59560 RepID=A0A6F9DP82_9ASCI|nr:phosphoribosylformylglycinamidine synthase-like [Phallusia mammillata]
MMVMLHYYQLANGSRTVIDNKLEQLLGNRGWEYSKEVCYNVWLEDDTVSVMDKRNLEWILRLFNETEKLQPDKPFLLEDNNDQNQLLLEVGPRLNQRTPFCTNATSICKNIGLVAVKGIEQSWRYKFVGEGVEAFETEVLDIVHDQMTQCRYKTPLSSLECKVDRKPWFEIDVIHGRSKALQAASDELGLAFDDWDIKFYANLFRHELLRNPTSVECFDLAQSNSEHSRHWFFKARMQIDGVDKPRSLFELVTNTIEHSKKNNVIAFRDNGSAINGFEVDIISVKNPGKPSAFKKSSQLQHITLTAETHNFPTGVAPFPGAATGTGGRQRDQHAIGRGAHVVAGTVGYCVGNLNLKNHQLPWEDKGTWPLCGNLASASKIIIEASNGASDYGNQFGEPVITGFFRSFGMKLPSGERREWLKPIMFSGGIGSISDCNVKKIKLEKGTTGLLVAKIGGPPYRIGVGGGSASSLMHGENDVSRDFNAVQRGDAEMQQKLQRAIRACIEMEDKNPILSIHDQGAGGNGNVLKEIVEPSGAVIYTKEFTLGDRSLNSLELWTAEYQESDAILVNKDNIDTLRGICQRERCPLDVVGELNGSGRIVLSEQDMLKTSPAKLPRLSDDQHVLHPVDLDLNLILGKMPQKHYSLVWIERKLLPVNYEKIVFNEALDRVLQLPSVASKRFLTNKVDRSVTGLVAQQQCVGPLHTPLADVAVTSLSHFTTRGSATAIGEQPLKILVNESTGARMTVGEALTNLVFAAVSDIQEIKCSANWMWPAKLPGEGARLRMACESMCEIMKHLGIAVDGGKDSLSMAASVGKEIVKSPGALVISAYAPCVDITLTVTPDLKCPIDDFYGWLIYVPMSNSPPHLGGSAFGQCFVQLGDKTPDLDDSALFVSAWTVTQQLIRSRLIASGHDVSDGGLVTCLLEMAFAGNCGLKIDASSECSLLEYWFSEKLGLVLETSDKDSVLEIYRDQGVKCVCLGKSIKERKVTIQYNGEVIIDGESTNTLRDTWEKTSFALEQLQCNPDCVTQEQKWLLECETEPCYNVTFDHLVLTKTEIQVAILREEGSNGDREMAVAFTAAGFQPWDITMQDLIDGAISLDRFRGVVFVGGFSYADVFGSAKGWAACCQFNSSVSKQLKHFRNRNDTFSLGVCNGCQLMALLGWIGNEGIVPDELSARQQPSVYLAPNVSNRFESRFVSVKIEKSNSIMMRGMEGSVLGVWVAHGEGRFQFNSKDLGKELLSKCCVPIRYVGHDGESTERYPLNANGSPAGIAGLCSADGRHLAVMPHPERCFQLWQWPWKPSSWQQMNQSPWLRMFQNALIWCQNN